MKILSVELDYLFIAILNCFRELLIDMVIYTTLSLIYKMSLKNQSFLNHKKNDIIINIKMVNSSIKFFIRIQYCEQILRYYDKNY